MNEEIITKLVEMAQKNVFGLNAEDKTNDKISTLHCKYNAENRSYDTLITRKNIKEKTSTEEEKENKTFNLDELKTFLKTSLEFKNALENSYKNQVMIEEKYANAKAQLFEQLETLQVTPQEKKKLLVLINTIAQLPEQSDSQNRVYLKTNEPGYAAYLSLRDENGLDNKDLHLTFVQRMQAPNGNSNTNYKKVDLQDVVKLVKDDKLKGLESTKNENDLER